MGLSLLARAVRQAGGPEALLKQLGPEKVAELLRTWKAIARPEQMVHPDKRITMFLAGRGWGKSQTVSGTVHEWVEEFPRIAVISPTAYDVRHTMVEGPSGILNSTPPNRPRPLYEPSLKRLTFWNGAQVFLFSAEEPDRFRGPQFNAVALDEMAAYVYIQEVWDTVMFAVRLGRKTRIAIATTPRPLPLIKKLYKEWKDYVDGKTSSSTVHVVEGTMYENEANLAPDFLKYIADTYEGTRLGRQEISGKILDDNPNAMFQRAWFEAGRLTLDELDDLCPEFNRIIVPIDPAETDKPTSDEVGIVAMARGWCTCKGRPEEHGFLLEDVSKIYSPKAWATEAIALFKRREADRLLAEVNAGGLLVKENLIANGAANLPYDEVWASRGKEIRHEPVAALYEQKKMHHVGNFGKAEDEMTSWDPRLPKSKKNPSPNRLDAISIGAHDLLIDPRVEPPKVGVTVISA
jgi:phage terminase large subunit-like protein